MRRKFSIILFEYKADLGGHKTALFESAGIFFQNLCIAKNPAMNQEVPCIPQNSAMCVLSFFLKCAIIDTVTGKVVGLFGVIAIKEHSCESSKSISEIPLIFSAENSNLTQQEVL